MTDENLNVVREIERLADEISYVIDHVLPESAQEKGQDFFESVREKAASIAETAVSQQRATKGQLRAMRNMLAGVQAWQRD